MPAPSIVQKIAALSLLFVWAVTGPCRADSQIRERVVMGWLERIRIEPWGFEVKAKLDSGTKTSSLGASHIKEFERKGKKWVRFRLQLKEPHSEQARSIEVERPLMRKVHIKRQDDLAEQRSVVTMEFCLNGRLYEDEFTLADRDEFNYPVLLGRDFLQETALIDPRAMWLTDASCMADREAAPEEEDASETAEQSSDQENI